MDSINFNLDIEENRNKLREKYGSLFVKAFIKLKEQNRFNSFFQEINLFKIFTKCYNNVVELFTSNSLIFLDVAKKFLNSLLTLKQINFNIKKYNEYKITSPESFYENYHKDLIFIKFCLDIYDHYTRNFESKSINV